MFKIKVITQGKEKTSWLAEALSEYEKRLQKDFIFIWHLAKDDKQMESLLSQEKFICLDSQGKSLTSEKFSLKLFTLLEKYGSRLTFCIGGPNGIPSHIKKKADFILSLSSLTFTHQMTRLLLLEQIYRAEQIRKGSPYVR